MAVDELVFYNSLSRSKEPFIPLRKKEVRIYACGPTVYDHAHIGNFRSFIFSDILVRSLLFFGYRVRFIRNITDVGHLTDDADLGQDKVELASRREHMSAWGLARLYAASFQKDAKKLNLLKPDGEPKATQHIKEQIRFIEELERENLTYQAKDGIYFDTEAFASYGALMPQKSRPLSEKSRITTGDDKKNIHDFALWKFSPKKAKRQMQWPSPWGMGFPGWHIECSAMSRKYLGFPFDIHTGGIDHIPIHHTNEIAQNDSVFGQKAVHYWLHNEFVMIDNEKMSKSKDNFYRLGDLEKRGHSPMAFRYQCLSAHYRSRLNFTWEGLGASENALSLLRRETRRLFAVIKKKNSLFSRFKPLGLEKEAVKKFKMALADDLNTPMALAVVWELVKNKEETISPEKKLGTLFCFDKVLGLNLKEELKKTAIPRRVAVMVKEREKMRKNKEWQVADRLRNKIEKAGFQVEDHILGPVVFSTD